MALERNVKKKPARTADRRNVWLLILTTLLIVVSVVLFTPPNEKINQGLDIQGGLSVVLTAKSTDGAPVTPEDMEKSRAIIESRVNALGASEATVQEQGSDQILVQIPGLADTEEALSLIHILLGRQLEGCPSARAAVKAAVVVPRAASVKEGARRPTKRKARRSARRKERHEGA